MFPAIRTKDDLLGKYTTDSIEEQQVGDFSVFCYLPFHSDGLFFTDPVMFDRECRGITFDILGRIVSRSLHKFFNIGECEETLPHNINWQDIDFVMEKRDGSAIFTVKCFDTFTFKTKRSFESNEAMAALKLLSLKQIEAVNDIVQKNFTIIFEYTSPKSPIVLVYEQSELTILHVRENVSGKYLSRQEIRDLVDEVGLDLPLVKVCTDQFLTDGVVDYKIIKQKAETLDGIEGWVFAFKNGNMLKQKTVWYTTLHRTVTFVRDRDVVAAILDDKYDDLLSYFEMSGRNCKRLKEIHRDVFEFIANKQLVVKQKAEDIAKLNLSFKDIAAQFIHDEDFCFIMDHLRNKRTDWFKWYRNNHLKAWSLEVITETQEDFLE